MEESRRTESAGGVVLNTRGEVLLVSQRGISWSLLKGHIDPGEDQLSAAQREIYEEAGIKNLAHIRDLGSYERCKISKDGGDDCSERKTIHISLFITDEEALRPVDSRNPEARWVARDEVTKFLAHYKDKEFFLSVLNTLP